jgi:hypothetical protein
MRAPLNDYVSQIEEACGEEGDYVIILRYIKRREAMDKILSRCKVERTVSGVMVKASYKGRELSLFTTGKILLKGIEEREEVERLLEELLSN